MASYIRWEGKNRETGTRTQVLDTTHADSLLDSDNGRWVTFCLEHDRYVNHSTLELALNASAHPLAWCQGCYDASDTTTTAEVEVAVWGPNLGKSEAMHVHTVGCADTKKGVYKGHTPWTITVTSFQQVVEDIYSDMIDEQPDSDWHDYAGDVHLYPCTGLSS